MGAHGRDAADWASRLFEIDVLLQLSGVDYREVADRAVPGRYGRAPVRFISRDDLLRNKRIAGREKDLADVKALETDEVT